MIGYAFRMLRGKSAVRQKLKKHFRGVRIEQIVTAARTFPIASKVDVQASLNELLKSYPNANLLGIHSAFGHETPTLAHLFTPGPFPVELGPLQHDDVDIGEETPARCLNNALWLLFEKDLPVGVLLSPSMEYGRVGGVHVEVAVPAGERGLRFSQDF